MTPNKNALKERWGITDQSQVDENTLNDAANQNTLNEENPFFAIDTHSPFLTSLKIIQRDSSFLYLPYSTQPLVEFHPDNGITIRTLQKEINISGRGLTILADQIGMQRVMWIRESDSGIDSGEESLFIGKIEIIDTM